LYYYKSGIYEQTSQKLIGGHAVRIIGWGQGLDASGNNQPYWLVANSWNTVFNYN
jgi:cathepsin B